TLAELRTRSERMFAFDSAAEVEETLTALANRPEQPLVAKLPRAPGTKEARYAQLLGGPVELAAPSRPIPVEPATAAVRAENERLAQLEQDTAELRRELEELKIQFASFRQQ